MKSILCALLIMLGLASPGAAAVVEIPDAGAVADVSLIGGWRLDNGHIMGALRVTMAPGWKTYWRAGGGTGIPPRFDWANSENLAGVTLHWPSPHLITVEGVTVIGYKNELVLPIEFTPKVAGQDITARARLQIGICKDVCIPASKNLSLSLKASATEPNFLIQLALADQPISPRAAGLNARSCHLEKTEDGYRLTGRFSLPHKGHKPEMVVFETPDPDIWIASATTSRKGATLEARADMISLSGKAFSPNPKALRITVIGEDQAIEMSGCRIARP